jgi:murein endopeptidase
VVRAYGRVHPDAPRVVIGDLSRRGGGPIDEHVSHQNGLDVDVYYPRLDHRLKPPSRVEQIDTRLARDLVRRFVAAGARLVLVGYNTPLRGPSGIVLPYPNHDSHMHVRIAQPRAGSR